MNARLIQALTRGAVVAIAAAVTAIAADATNIVQIGTDDPIVAQVTLAVILGIVQAVMKWIGGVTVSADGDHVAGASLGSRSPNALAV